MTFSVSPQNESVFDVGRAKNLWVNYFVWQVVDTNTRYFCVITMRYNMFELKTFKIGLWSRKKRGCSPRKNMLTEFCRCSFKWRCLSFQSYPETLSSTPPEWVNNNKELIEQFFFLSQRACKVSRREKHRKVATIFKFVLFCCSSWGLQHSLSFSVTFCLRGAFFFNPPLPLTLLSYSLC